MNSSHMNLSQIQYYVRVVNDKLQVMDISWAMKSTSLVGSTIIAYWNQFQFFYDINQILVQYCTCLCKLSIQFGLFHSILLLRLSNPFLHSIADSLIFSTIQVDDWSKGWANNGDIQKQSHPSILMATSFHQLIFDSLSQPWDLIVLYLSYCT